MQKFILMMLAGLLLLFVFNPLTDVGPFWAQLAFGACLGSGLFLLGLVKTAAEILRR